MLWAKHSLPFSIYNVPVGGYASKHHRFLCGQRDNEEKRKACGIQGASLSLRQSRLNVKKFCPFYGGKANGICYNSYNIFCDSTVKGD